MVLTRVLRAAQDQMERAEELVRKKELAQLERLVQDAHEHCARVVGLIEKAELESLFGRSLAHWFVAVRWAPKIA